ncbi:hypothetical protein D7V97_22960 [Corallococcus sp. CA053C]|nr:hypothetical protein D7V97_22960 [Corallococcus sp. CA053C]
MTVARPGAWMPAGGQQPAERAGGGSGALFRAIIVRTDAEAARCCWSSAATFASTSSTRPPFSSCQRRWRRTSWSTSASSCEESGVSSFTVSDR